MDLTYAGNIVPSKDRCKDSLWILGGIIARHALMLDMMPISCRLVMLGQSFYASLFIIACKI